MDSGVYKFRKRRPKTNVEWHQSQIDPMILLEQVKMYPFIFNKDHANYRDKVLKSSVWYRICKNMFPEFESYSAATKLRMHYETRQRWMALRVAIMREAKHIIETGSSRTTVREGVRQLEFLMAYINNKNCQKLAKAWGLSRLPNDDIIPNDIKHLLERKKSSKTGNITEDEDSDLLNDEDGLYDDEDDDINSDHNSSEIKTGRLSPNTSASIEGAITPPINFKLLRSSKQLPNQKLLKRTKRTNHAEQILPDSADETDAIQLPPKSFVKMQSDRLGGYGEQINSNHLLEIIKKYPFVFNPFHPKFRERTLRKKGWERICAVMFPEYPNCSQESKFEIGYKLRRRWTSLRAKTSGEAKDCLKTGKPLRPELLFLLPYIKSPQSEELTKKLGIKRLPNDDIVPDDIEMSKEGDDNDNDNYDDPFDGDDDEFLPKIHTDIDEFLKMSSRAGVNNTEQNHKSMHATCSSQSLRKRQHTGTEAATQRQLSEYLAKFKKRLLQQDFDVGKDENDKDRLFLLSLTDDFKQIPAHKKIYVKAKIATVLVHAMEN